MNYEQTIAEDARREILTELARQTDGTLNDASMTRVLDTVGIRRSREWVQTQLQKLKELGAVNLRTVACYTVGTITRTGRDHVERRSVIVGVSAMADED